MKEARITIEIDREGRISADADGFGGDACLEAIAQLLEGLATEVATVDRKSQPPAATIASRVTLQPGRKR
ncbi:MAG: DUF2997 domain-containing protein [Myxococcales bacterium]|nr:DUF2997 domain-containing protein [Myxococcales bacterium]